MKRRISVWVIALAFSTAIGLTACDNENFNDLLGPTLTEEEVIEGLRAALSVGTDTSVANLNRMDGYYQDQIVRILMPPELQGIESTLSSLGLSNEVENFKISLNRAAEDAASEAKPIFINAITSITIEDAFGILRGSDTSATAYLIDKTSNSLTNAFAPKINASLDKPLIPGINQSTNQIYNTIRTGYNAWAFLNGSPPLSSSIGEYTTEKALNGLFYKVQEEEKKIRNNRLHRVTDILRKVFGS